MLPSGWTERLVRVEGPLTAGAVGWCLEPHDLAISKLIAGRDKDVDYVSVLVRERMVDPSEIENRLDTVSITDQRVAAARQRLRRIVVQSA